MSKEKQIEEMVSDIEQSVMLDSLSRCRIVAEELYIKGYRKQSEGEWVKDNASKFEHRYNCSVCDFRQIGKPTPYCPNCGARMKGGE